jgi:transposase
MTAEITLKHERVDDIPLLLGELERMEVARLVNEHFATHGNWQGLSLGQVVSGWVTFILSEANHRMSHVEPWAASRLQTLNRSLGAEVRALDFSDDRLAAVLDYLSQDEAWTTFEQRLNQVMLRVYDLRPERVRVDATTAKFYGRITEEGLFQFGHSKDHRPDLPQVKVNLSALDPLGLPLTTTVVSGNCADDPLYVPEIKCVQASLERHGLTYIGDAKMAALTTRGFVAASDDYYLCPLPATQVSAAALAQLLAPVWNQTQPLTAIFPPLANAEATAPPQPLAEGYEYPVAMEASIEGRPVRWQERRLVVKSLAAAEAQARTLATHLANAQAEIAALNQRRQGKKVFASETELRKAGEQILAKYHINDLLRLDCQTSEQRRQLRRYGPRPAQEKVERTIHIRAQVDEDVLAQRQRSLGWRIYATNQPAHLLSLAQAVLAYREEFRVEHGFSRLKGKPLSLTPLYLSTEQRVSGLLRLLLIALRVLCLIEFRVRRHLHSEGTHLAGLYPGNPKRTTARPTTERMLRTFEGLTLTTIHRASEEIIHLTPLSALQLRILHLLALSPDIYLRLLHHSSQPSLKLSEP